MPDAYSDIELEQYIKLAMSRWREPANLAKIIGKETMKRLALESGEGAVRRLPALQAAAQKLNLGTNPGQAYNAFVSGLKWRPVPAQVQQAIVKPLTQLTEPRYLLRGITPHSNVVQPFMERGALKSFLHATPHPNVITQYAGSMAPHAAAGVPQAGAGMFGTLQAFKPRAGQSYVPDFVLDATRGAGWARSGWADAVPEIKQLATQTGKDLASAVQGRAYETAVNSQNKRLGTFLYRRARNTVSGASTRDPASLGRLIGDFDIARIPVSQRGKAEGLARQWNTWVNKPVMPAKALKPSAALDAVNADAITKFRTPVAPPVQPAVQPAAPPFMSKVRSWFGGTKAAADDADLHARFQPDYTPEQLENLGVYDALYRGQAPRLASLGAWKPEWISEHDPKGWAQWYKRYAAGRRLEGEDDRQIKRWLSLKARHGGPFTKNPTARRGWALRNWAIDPSKLVPDQAQQVNEMLDEHQRKAMQKFVQEKAAELNAKSAEESPPRTAVIIRGNPKFVNGNPAADAFYAKLQKHLEQQGYTVSQDAGEPHTAPQAANLWLAHSRGVDRLPYAPKGTRGIALGAPGGINHPDDTAMTPGDVPTAAHYKLTPEMLKALDALVQEKTAELNAKSAAAPELATQFISTAELMGSRGRARMYGRPEPEGRDHDYIVFTDDAKKHNELRQTLRTLAQQHGYKLKQRPGGFLTASGNNTDLSFYPAARRALIHKAWALQEAGMSKDDAWAKVEAEKTAELAPEVQLQEHQQRVADRVSGEDPRLLVYHGLGSGKSLSAIAAAETARRTSGGQYGIVVPASLRGNFQKELAKFAPGSNPEILSYSGLALGKKFQSQPDTLVMDEAQRLRNPDSAASRAAREAAQKAKRLVLLSGTPITNSPTDMASLISMLTNRDITPKEFESRYIGYKSKFPGVIPWLRGAQWGEVPYVKNEKELRQVLEGRVDYHPSKTPEGVDVQEEVIKTPLTKAQQKIQKAIRTKVPPGFLWKLDKEFPMSREELSKMNSFLNGLRQVSLSTQSFRGDRDPLKAFDQSGKLQTAMQNLQKALESDERKKALIYSNFVESGVNPYAAALDRAKIPYGIFHGGISPEARQKALKEYNEGKLRALLIGPAGAEGISTKGTNLIQLLDPHWNEARIQQARGRGLRFDSHAGLPEDLKNVQVQRYLSGSEEPGFLGKLMGKRRQRTGDEVLESLSQNKEQLNEAFRKILREVGTPARKNDQAEEPENV